MTQPRFVQEFKSYPKAKKSAVTRRLLRIFEENSEEKTAIVENLAGNLKMEKSDHEDVAPRECAVAESLGAIVAPSAKDFKHASLKVHSPAEFLEFLQIA